MQLRVFVAVLPLGGTTAREGGSVLVFTGRTGLIEEATNDLWVFFLGGVMGLRFLPFSEDIETEEVVFDVRLDFEEEPLFDDLLLGMEVGVATLPVVLEVEVGALVSFELPRLLGCFPFCFFARLWVASVEDASLASSSINGCLVDFLVIGILVSVEGRF
jgi:hypothetical protein